MADFQPPPTYAEVILVDDATGRPAFNPIWLNWFLALAQVLSGGSGGSIAHNLLSGLQGGTTDEYYHLTQTEHSIFSGTKAANLVLAGPTVGAPATPSFRSLVTADLANQIVTYAKIQNVTDVRLLGRSAGSAGAPMEITVGSGLSLAAGTLTNTATTAAAITVANEATDTTCFPVFVTAATGDLGPKSNANLTFNSSTAAFGANQVTMLGGAAPGASTTAQLTGFVSGGNPDLLYVNPSGSANNRAGDLIRTSTGFIWRFLNDAHSSALNILNATGGQAAGLTLLDTSPSNFVVGHTAALTIGQAGRFQTYGTTDATSWNLHGRYSNDANAPVQVMAKSRGASPGTNTIVQSGDALGAILFYGANGSAFDYAAWIICEVDGTPGAADMPGRLRFLTTTDGGTTANEALRIDNAQRNILGGTASVTVGNAGRWQLNGITAAGAQGQISSFAADATTAPTIALSKSRNAAVAGNTIVQSGDVLGRVLAYGADGTNYDTAAQISFEVDGTPGAGTDMPGRIVFSTSPDASATLTEAFRVDSAQKTIFQVDRALRFNNQTSAAAAAVGTLNNAPAAGDPGYWLKINIAGTNYAIPAWAG